MCCDPCGSDLPAVGECPECGEPVDKDGYTRYRCAYSPRICDLCEYSPCDDSC